MSGGLTEKSKFPGLRDLAFKIQKISEDHPDYSRAWEVVRTCCSHLCALEAISELTRRLEAASQPMPATVNNLCADEIPGMEAYTREAERGECIYIVYPESRWVSKDIITGWFDDAVANGKIDATMDWKNPTTEQMALLLEDIGFISIGKSRE